MWSQLLKDKGLSIKHFDSFNWGTLAQIIEDTYGILPTTTLGILHTHRWIHKFQEISPNYTSNLNTIHTWWAKLQYCLRNISLGPTCGYCIIIYSNIASFTEYKRVEKVYKCMPIHLPPQSGNRSNYCLKSIPQMKTSWYCQHALLLRCISWFITDNNSVAQYPIFWIWCTTSPCSLILLNK